MLVIYLEKVVEDETRYSILFSKTTLIEKGTAVRFVRMYEIYNPIRKKLSDKFLMRLKSGYSFTFLDFSSKPEDIVLGIGEDPRTIIKYYTTNESEKVNFIL